MLCYRCGGHVKDGSPACEGCGQTFALGLKPGPIAGFGTGSRRHRVAIEGTPYKPGDAVGRRYKIKEHLGAGPVGWVYRAQDTEADVDVALKILSPRFLQTAEEKKAFFAELQKARALSHPNLVRVFDAGADQDRPFVAQQLLEGLTLRRIMELRRQKGQGFSLKEVEPIVAQIASALEAAGEQFAHGDLKPDNVIVLPDLLKLTDFGLAVSLPRAPFMAAQKAGGVHRYLAPEFLVGERLDARTDVYSLGVMLGEMLSGAQYEPALDVLARNPGLPRGVESVFRRAVAARPQDRFANAQDLADELSELLEVTLPGAAMGPHTRPNAQRPSTPPPMPVAIPVVPAPQVQLSASAAGGAGLAAATTAPALPAMPPAPPEADVDDVEIEEVRTDPRLRIQRALQAQDDQPGSRVSAEARRAPTPGTSSGAMQIPGTLQTPVQPEPERPHAPLSAATNGKGADVAAVAARLGATPALLTAETAVRFAPTAPSPATSSEVATPLAVTPVASAPAAPSHPASAAPQASPPAPASAAVSLSAASTPAAAEPAASATPPTIPMPGLDELEVTDAGDKTPQRGGGKRRGRGKRHEKEKRHGQKRGRDPEWTNAPATQAAAAQATGAEQRSEPSFQAAPAPAVASHAAFEAPAAIALPEVAAQAASVNGAALPVEVPAPPTEAAAKKRRATPAATPSFGAIAESKARFSIPIVKLGGGVLAALLCAVVWLAVRANAGSEGAKADQTVKEASAAAEAKPAASKGAAQAVAAESKQAQPAGAPSPAATPNAPAARPAEQPAPASSRGAADQRRAAREEQNRELAERMLARHDARMGSPAQKAKADDRRRAQEEALAQAEARRAQETKASSSTAAAAQPAQAEPPPTVATATAGGIPAADDGESMLLSKDPKARQKAAAELSAAAKAEAAVPARDDGKLRAVAVPAVAQVASGGGGCPAGMQRIPGGRALIGSDPKDDLRNFGDRNLTAVQIAAYCIDAYEWPNTPGKLPRFGVAFSEAQSLCARDGKRLCSEEEWEHACKGPDDQRFPYGSQFDAEVCNTQDKAENPRQVTSAGAFKSCRSGYGVYDLSGNVAEWTSSSFGGGSEKAVKGGSASRPGFDDRCASRRKLGTGVHDIKVGFRCCKD